MSGKKAVRLLAGVLLVCCLIVGGPGGALAQLSVPTNGDGHEGLEPGEISLDKFAEPVEGTQNRWKVTLTLFGRGLAQSSDIVLLIDRSGSMGQSSGRMEAAKAAASQFVESLLTEENPETRIAVMSFASDVTTDTGFTDHTGKSSVLAAINGLSANGGTWTQKALREAHLLLSTSSADSKTIVLLSDGQPTYSYGLSSPSTDDFVKVGNEYHSRDDLPETAFVEDRVGTGSQIKTRVWPFSNYYYHHGNSAVAESRFAKDAGITVYAIGLTPGSEGKGVLERIAASADKYYDASTSDLTPIFLAIAGSLTPAGTEATVKDKVFHLFFIPDDAPEIETSPGTSATYDKETNTITWSIGTIGSTPIWMSYVIEAKASAPGGLHDANEYATVSYTDIGGENAEESFPVPQVEVIRDPECTHLTITAHSATKTYDGNEHIVDLFDVEGLLEGHELSGVSAYGRGKDVGTYTVELNYDEITIVDGENIVTDQYCVEYNNGTLNIEPRPITVKANNHSKVQGSPDPVFTYYVSSELGVVEGDSFEGALARQPGETPGQYDILQGTLSLGDNYIITYIKGTLTITPVSPGGGDTPGPEIPIPDDPTPLEPTLNKEDHYAYIQGYEDNTVRPEGHITREEVAAVFFRLLDADYREIIRTLVADFADVLPDRWSSKHIATLAAGGILEGYPDGTFKPGASITRAELATIAARFDDLEELDTNAFPDVAGHWAEKYINSAAAKGWVEGYEDGTFKPDQPITRAEFVTLVNRVLERKVHKDSILPEARQFPDLPPNAWYYEAMQEAINSHLYERQEDGYEIWLEIIYPEIEM